MSIFAVRVYTGKEIEVKDMLRFVLEKHPFKMVKAIHAFETFTQSFRGKDSARKEFRSAVPGYIFIETNDYLPRLRKELWHLINSVPKVCQIFDYCIPKEEMDHFFETVDVEPDIDIHFSQDAKSEQEKIIEAKQALHEANMHEEEVENETKTVVDQVNNMKAHDCKNGGLRQMIERCKACIRSKKESFVFPFSLFLKTRKRIDPKNQMSVQELTFGDFIIPEIIKTLKLEVRTE